jgi:abhydrolase domain-containing protein 14
MIEITSHTISANSCAIHYLRAGAQDDPIVILLHGMKFQASTWKELGTLEHLAGAGFQVIAMDMPGFGGSPACSAEQDSVLEFNIRHQNLVSALVLVGAVGVEENRSRLSSITVPTLIIWGRDDRISPLTNCQLLHSAIHGSKKIIIEGAPHPCYLDNPDIWHRELVNFLNSPAQ